MISLNLSELTLGYQYQNSQTTFNAFAVLANGVDVVIYENDASHQYTVYPMQQVDDNIWRVSINGDLAGVFYNYRITRGVHQLICSDPYAFSSSVNSKRSCVIDLDAITEVVPDTPHSAVGIERAVIYETHIRDFTVGRAGVSNPGKYVGVAQGDGLDYLVNLGITHIHFLPLQDFSSIDERQADAYNWGYDPENYFVPEGSYATDPTDPICRVRELKAMVNSLHQAGLGAILDVVYNHTYHAAWHAFEIMAPSIYFRKDQDSNYCNGSGCGNEINSEHPMVRHHIIASLKHWQNFYGFDGFRFDLMGLIDIETMQMVRRELQADNANVILYGEPWTADITPLPLEKRMIKGQQDNMQIALFNDDYRNLLKGDSDGIEHGFIQGDLTHLHHIKTGMLGSINYLNQHVSFAKTPFETINYVSAHDNLILYDKIKKSTGWDDIAVKRSTKLAFAMVLLSFGVPFIQAGTEIMHSKKMDHNSYRSGDDINAINWQLQTQHADLYQWLKQLISFRKGMPCYHQYSATEIAENVILYHHLAVVGMQIKQANHTSPYTLILANGSLEAQNLTLLAANDRKIVLQSSEQIKLEETHVILDAQGVVVIQGNAPMIETSEEQLVQPEDGHSKIKEK